MACNFPLHAQVTGINPKTGKKLVRVIREDVYRKLSTADQDDFIEVPCGRCIECRLKYSRQWADRLMIEAERYPDNQKHFVTITYNDMFVPRVEWLDEETGETGEVLTLRKKEMQDFIKRIRKNYDTVCAERGIEPNHIKYYLCGEYGSHTARPHYHMIIFGLPLDDLELLPSRTKSGALQWFSSFLDKCWYEHVKLGDKSKKISKGFVTRSDVSWDTCAYVARYILKKRKGDASKVYDYYNLQPEFTLMSRKPAIALEYFQENKDKIYAYDEFYISTPQGARAVRPSRYYDKLFDIENPELMEEIKKKREECMRSSKNAKLSQTSLDYFSMLENQDEAKKAIIFNSLKRRLD